MSRIRQRPFLILCAVAHLTCWQHAICHRKPTTLPTAGAHHIEHSTTPFVNRSSVDAKNAALCTRIPHATFKVCTCCAAWTPRKCLATCLRCHESSLFYTLRSESKNSRTILTPCLESLLRPPRSTRIYFHLLRLRQTTHRDSITLARTSFFAHGTPMISPCPSLTSSYVPQYFETS